MSPGFPSVAPWARGELQPSWNGGNASSVAAPRSGGRVDIAYSSLRQCGEEAPGPEPDFRVQAACVNPRAVQPAHVKPRQTNTIAPPSATRRTRTHPAKYRSFRKYGHVVPSPANVSQRDPTLRARRRTCACTEIGRGRNASSHVHPQRNRMTYGTARHCRNHAVHFAPRARHRGLHPARLGLLL